AGWRGAAGRSGSVGRVGSPPGGGGGGGGPAMCRPSYPIAGRTETRPPRNRRGRSDRFDEAEVASPERDFFEFAFEPAADEFGFAGRVLAGPAVFAFGGQFDRCAHAFDFPFDVEPFAEFPELFRFGFFLFGFVFDPGFPLAFLPFFCFGSGRNPLRRDRDLAEAVRRLERHGRGAYFHRAVRVEFHPQVEARVDRFFKTAAAGAGGFAFTEFDFLEEGFGFPHRDFALRPQFLFAFFEVVGAEHHFAGFADAVGAAGDARLEFAEDRCFLCQRRRRQHAERQHSGRGQNAGHPRRSHAASPL